MAAATSRDHGGQHRIIFSGPVGAGKTTAICAVSDIAPVQTDVRATDGIRRVKLTTTVAMDYGLLRLGGDERVHLYGTPGQERFDFMWEILSEGAIGLVLLITNNRPDPLGDLRFFLLAFEAVLASTRLAVGVTAMDLRRRPGLADYRDSLSEAGLTAPVFEIDARRRADVATLIRALLLSEDPGLGAACGGDPAITDPFLPAWQSRP